MSKASRECKEYIKDYSRLAHRNIDTEYVRKTYTGDWKSAYRRQR